MTTPTVSLPPRYQVYLVDYSRYQVMDTRPYGSPGEPVPASRTYAAEGWAQRRARQLNG